MFKQLSLIAAGLLLASSSVAFADDDTNAVSGLYVGALGGWAFSKIPNNNMADSSYRKRKQYTFGGNLGVDYAWDDNWLSGLEVGYLNFGKTTYYYSPSGTVDLKNSGIQAMLTGTYVMDSGFNVFVKAGAVDAKTKETDNGAGPFASNESKWLPAAALGAGYLVTQAVNLTLQYEHVFGQTWDTQGSITKPMTQDAVMIGLSYKFGT